MIPHSDAKDVVELDQMRRQSRPRPPTGGYSVTRRPCRATNFRTHCHKDKVARGLCPLANTIMDHSSHGARRTGPPPPPLKVSSIPLVDYKKAVINGRYQEVLFGV